MRIAITTLTTPPQPLGVGRYLISLLDALQEVDKRNLYYIFTSLDNYHLFNIWEENFSEIRLKFTHNPRWVMRPAYFLWQNTIFLLLLKRMKIDLLHLPNLLPLLSRHIPTVVTIHDLGEMKINKKYNKLRQYYRQSILPITVRNARRIITVSKSTQSDLQSLLGVKKSKIDITYEGVNTFLFNPPTDIALDWKNCEKFVDSPFIFYAGAMFKHKNLARLIKAFSMIKESANIPHKLIIAGKISGEYENLLSLVEELCLEQEVKFIGFISDSELVSLYRCATLFTYIPLNEGFGLPVLEAMACGTPVVASNVSSIPEVAGNAAILVDPLNIKAIASKLLEVITDEEILETLTSNGIKQVKSFSWRNCAQLTIKSYERSINKY